MNNQKYIDFQVSPYALPKVCEALYNNGIIDGCITLEDDEIHIRWEYNINRFSPHRNRGNGETNDEEK